MKRKQKHKRADYAGKPSGKSKYARKHNAQARGIYSDTSPFRH